MFKPICKNRCYYVALHKLLMQVRAVGKYTNNMLQEDSDKH